MAVGERNDSTPRTTADFLAIIRTATHPIAQDVQELRASLAVQLTELRKRDDAHQCQIQELRERYATSTETIRSIGEKLDGIRDQVAKLVAALPMADDVAELDRRVEQVEDAVAEFGAALRIIKWVGVTIGALAIVLLWQIITGQLSIQ
jgi:chromosome segregation ATPase